MMTSVDCDPDSAYVPADHVSDPDSTDVGQTEVALADQDCRQNPPTTQMMT